MFGFFDTLMKRVNDQAAEYAAAQSKVASRAWEGWFDPFHVLHPAKVTAERPMRGKASRSEPAARGGRSF